MINTYRSKKIKELNNFLYKGNIATAPLNKESLNDNSFSLNSTNDITDSDTSKITENKPSKDLDDDINNIFN